LIFPNCPKCGKKEYDIKQKDIVWKPNGHKYKMGDKVVEAVDPIALRGTCTYCRTVVDFKVKDMNREKVDFT
jgi:hypothetical protein